MLFHVFKYYLAYHQQKEQVTLSISKTMYSYAVAEHVQILY